MSAEILSMALEPTVFEPQIINNTELDTQIEQFEQDLVRHTPAIVEALPNFYGDDDFVREALVPGKLIRITPLVAGEDPMKVNVPTHAIKKHLYGVRYSLDFETSDGFWRAGLPVFDFGQRGVYRLGKLGVVNASQEEITADALRKNRGFIRRNPQLMYSEVFPKSSAFRQIMSGFMDRFYED